MRALLTLAGAIAASGLMACREVTPPQEFDREARAFLDLLATHSVDSALTLLDTDGDRSVSRVALAAIRDSVRPFDIASAELINWEVVEFGGGVTAARLIYEVSAGKRWSLITVTLRRSASAARVQGMEWTPTLGRLAELNAFSMRGRSVAHYAFLLLAFASVATCVIGAIFAARHRMGILWVVFCLIGVSKSMINWTTGGVALKPVTVQLLGAGYMRSGLYGPWIVSWSLPLGTVLMFLAWRRRLAPAPEKGPAVAA